MLALARAEWRKPGQRADQMMLDLIANTVAEMDRALVALESQAASRPDR